jgi:hypothetical protein
MGLNSTIHSLHGNAKAPSRRSRARTMFLEGAGIGDVMAVTGLSERTARLYQHEAHREIARCGEIVIEIPPDLTDEERASFKNYVQTHCLMTFLRSRVKSLI